MNKLKRTLDDLDDRCFIYSVLLNQAERLYSNLKLLFKIPLILISSAMSIINSSFSNEDNTLKVINISFNIITALTLSLGATLQLEMKQQDFNNAKKKFIKLSSIIEQKLISNEEITSDFVASIINQYDNIVDGIDYELPDYILKRVRNQYAGIKTLPVIINGIKKAETERPPSCGLETVRIETNYVM